MGSFGESFWFFLCKMMFVYLKLICYFKGIRIYNWDFFIFVFKLVIYFMICCINFLLWECFFQRIVRDDFFLGIGIVLIDVNVCRCMFYQRGMRGVIFFFGRGKGGLICLWRWRSVCIIYFFLLLYFLFRLVRGLIMKLVFVMIICQV